MSSVSSFSRPESSAVARRPHAVHGRIQQLDLTEAGRRLLARCRERAHAIEQQLLEGLSAQEERTIRKWLVRVAVETAKGASV